VSSRNTAQFYLKVRLRSQRYVFNFLLLSTRYRAIPLWRNFSTSKGPQTILTFEILKANPYSWTRLANVLFVDQPVGSGFSQGDTLPIGHSPNDNDAVTAAYVQWLGNFLNKFPALKGKKIHLLGESYAGIYVRQPTISNRLA
jgi:carboxypeptidase C (cathepsin A)